MAFPASFTLGSIANVFVAGISGGATPGGESVPSTFYLLFSKDLLGAISTAVVMYGASLFLLGVTFVTLMILLKKRKEMSSAFNFVVVYSGVVILFIILTYPLNVGPFRILDFITLLFPIFSSIFILRLTKRRTWVRPAFVAVVVILFVLQFYACQPLIPSANAISNDLPKNEPLVYVNVVNSVYQRDMMYFAQNYTNGRIASDDVSQNQLVGLTNLSFSNTQLFQGYYYPLDPTLPASQYYYFMIHLPGVSGGLQESAEYRTTSVILGAIYNSSVIYTNGESFILLNKDGQ